ncbi:MAG: CARDB domain-containing protein, partial [Clostridia bacterium]|nr:CARDB domain-containing protein [Clostridia bacterium]
IITYTITVENVGNQTITDITVSDTMGRDGAAVTLASGYSWTIDILAVGESKEIKATYEVTEADVTTGKVTNAATVSEAEDPTGKTPEVDGTDAKTDDPTDKAESKLKVTKTSELPDGKTTVAAGDIITYTITVENVGNQTITDITVADTLSRDGAKVTLADGYSWTIDSLAVGVSKEIVATYEVTEADVTIGKVTNAATVTEAKDPEGNTPDVDDDDGKTEDNTVAAEPKLKVNKTSDVPEGKKAALGDTITYTITVENIGNQTITDITVSDTMGRDGAKVTLADGYSWTIGTLAVGESKKILATYVVTEEDITAGSVTNAATIESAKDPEGKTPAVDDDGGKTDNDTVDAEPKLKVTKTSKLPTGKTVVAAGDIITYTITVENVGNQTITDITVADTLSRDGAAVTLAAGYSWTIDSLAIGEKRDIVATYEVTEADVSIGKVTNTATVSEAKDPEGNTPDVDDDDGKTGDDTIASEPKLKVTKTSKLPNGKTAADVGDIITYTVTVENIGNQTVSNITVSDTMSREGARVKLADGYSWTIASLAPGKTSTIIATYTVTAADLQQGGITNAAAIDSAQDPTGKKPKVDLEDAKVTDNTVGVGSLTLKTKTTGNDADPEHVFTYVIQFSAEGSFSYTGSKSGKIRSGDKIKLKGGQSITIAGLPAGTVFTISEPKTDGYKATFTGERGTIKAGEDSVAYIVNEKNKMPPTGDRSDPVLWAALMLISAAGALWMGKRRHAVR